MQIFVPQNNEILIDYIISSFLFFRKSYVMQRVILRLQPKQLSLTVVSAIAQMDTLYAGLVDIFPKAGSSLHALDILILKMNWICRCVSNVNHTS